MCVCNIISSHATIRDNQTGRKKRYSGASSKMQIQIGYGILWWLPVFSVLIFLYMLFRIAFADADFTLLRKGRAKQHELEDKVVWITGASQGIGEALAKELACLGAKLILSARRQTELMRVKESLSGKNAPDEVMILPLDLTAGSSAIKEAVKKAESFFNGVGVDVMVLNAAYERPKTSALDTSETALEATFEVNVIGTIMLTQCLAPSMLKRGKGHFVVMSSAAGKTPAPGQAVYAASKHAIHGYFDSLRSELGKSGIKVTLICPGPIETSSAIVRTSTGLFEKKMLLSRCVELTVIAITHGLNEVWISNQPVLAVMYLMQYFPSFGHFLMGWVGPKRLGAIERGANAYSLNLLFGKSEKRVPRKRE